MDGDQLSNSAADHLMHADARILVIRADASAQIGTGHVMRCLALAQGWQRAGGQAAFAQAQSTRALEQRLSSEGFEIVRLGTELGSTDDSALTVALARQHGASWVVVDGYHFGADYQQRIKDAGLRLLVFDDNGHAEHYCADLLLNQNLHADASLYHRCARHTRLLLGTRYVQLRREFLDWRESRRDIPSVARKILVTLGGSDPANVTGRVIQSLAHLRDLEAVVVVGCINPNLDKLRSALRTSHLSFRLVVDAPNMPELMAWADVAISAGGSTSWELAFMGLPSLVLVLADNQRAVADALDAAQIARKTALDDVALELGALLVDADRRSAMSRRACQLVDGDGADRTISYLCSVKG